METYGTAPDVVVSGDPHVTIPYIPAHLDYMLYELLKNAMRCGGAGRQKAGSGAEQGRGRRARVYWLNGLWGRRFRHMPASSVVGRKHACLHTLELSYLYFPPTHGRANLRDNAGRWWSRAGRNKQRGKRRRAARAIRCVCAPLQLARSHNCPCAPAMPLSSPRVP